MGEGTATAVVGAEGFVGRRLVVALRRRGLIVSTFTRQVPFVSANGRAAQGLAAARTIYWLVSNINPQTAETRPDWVAADAEAFEHLLSVVRQTDTAPTIVLVSSGGTVYDPTGAPPYSEDSPTGALSAYPRLKLRLEHTLLEERRDAGHSVVLRVSNAYGPGQPVGRGQGVVAHWLRALFERRPVVIFGDPRTTRDYVYVDDVVDAMVRVHERGTSVPHILNIGSGVPTTLQELAETILDVAGVSPVELRHQEARSFDLSRTWLDVRAAASALDWRPTTDLRTGIRATWNAMNLVPEGSR